MCLRRAQQTYLSCSSILIVYSFKTSFGRSNKYFIGGISYLRNPFNNHSCCDAAFFKNFFFHEWIEFSKKIKSKIQSKNHSAPFNIIVEDDRCLNNSIESSLLIKTSHEFCWTRSRSLWIILKSSFCQRHDWLEHDLSIEEVNIESTSQVWENKTRKLWTL